MPGVTGSVIGLDMTVQCWYTMTGYCRDTLPVPGVIGSVLGLDMTVQCWYTVTGYCRDYPASAWCYRVSVRAGHDSPVLVYRDWVL